MNRTKTKPESLFAKLVRAVGLGPKCPHCGQDLILVAKMFHKVCRKCRRIIREEV